MNRLLHDLQCDAIKHRSMLDVIEEILSGIINKADSDGGLDVKLVDNAIIVARHGQREPIIIQFKKGLSYRERKAKYENQISKVSK